jgi:acetate kinase
MQNVLTLNGGSSSIRFAIYAAGDARKKLLSGKVDRIGVSGTSLNVDGGQIPVDATDHRSAVAFLLHWLESQPTFASVGAVGHRVVHGMQHSNPERITSELLAELKGIVPYDPEHLPREIELMETMAAQHGDLPQVACFDTAFHRSMPRVATLIPIPRRYAAQGIQRYGFHGLSYTYLMGELRRLQIAAAVEGRVILAHLGNGASLAAVLDGRCLDTSMGFTPNSGVMMSTRSGDLDPGVIGFLAQAESMDAATFQKMVTHESGLMGLSETSSDIRDLLEREGRDVRAAEAVELFCYQIKKCIGGFAAALGGVDTLVFAGGIGENSPVVRSRICQGLGFLGIDLSETRNGQNAALISADTGRTAVHVIPTDEESVIARSTIEVLGLGNRGFDR